MTVFDFIYIIGFGVAFLMSLIAFYSIDLEDKECFICKIVCAVLVGLLSWAVPIWWIGFEIYKRLGEK